MQTINGGISHLASLARVLTGPRQRYRLQKTSFRILVGIYYHNIPTQTPQSGYHGVTEVAKSANIPKMAEKCLNCISARPKKAQNGGYVAFSPMYTCLALI